MLDCKTRRTCFLITPIQPISREEAERRANALPLNAWTTDLTRLPLPLLKGLNYWQSLPAPFGCPEILQFDTLKIANSLKDALISERHLGDDMMPVFQSFFIGPRLEQRLHIPSSREQKFPLGDVSPKLLLQVREQSSLLDAWRSPLAGKGTFECFKDLNYLKFEALHLPLCDSTGTIFRVITLMDFGPDKEL